MFSPTGNSHVAASSLNPRRRQRTGSDDSVALRYNPKRLRRSVLSSETFKPPSKNQVNGYIQHVQNAPLVNGHVHETRPQRDASVDTTSLAIRNRGSKKGEREKRAIRSDRSIELVKLTASTRRLFRVADFFHLDEERQLYRNAALNYSRPSSASSKLRYIFKHSSRGLRGTSLTNVQKNGVEKLLRRLATPLP